MLRNGTVFVIGAGVSREFGMPLGGPLKDLISAVLPTPNGGGEVSVRGALFDNAATVNRLSEACVRLRRGLFPAASIDNLVDHLRDDLDVVRIAKLGIVAAILNSERGCRDSVDQSSKSFRGNLDCTYLQIFRLIVANVPKAGLANAFARVRFINFNYDRCLEVYLLQSLSAYSGLSFEEAAGILRKVTIYHPYGVVGGPEWLSPTGIPFGAALNAVPIQSLSEGIRTFSEERSSKADNGQLDNIVSTADRLIFLGCHPHPQNMALLAPTALRATTVYATAYMLPPGDEHSKPSLDSFSGPATDALRQTFGDWKRHAHFSAPQFKIEPITALQMVAKYGLEWLD